MLDYADHVPLVVCVNRSDELRARTDETRRRTYTVPTLQLEERNSFATLYYVCVGVYLLRLVFNCRRLSRPYTTKRNISNVIRLDKIAERFIKPATHGGTNVKVVVITRIALAPLCGLFLFKHKRPRT